MPCLISNFKFNGENNAEPTKEIETEFRNKALKGLSGSITVYKATKDFIIE